MSEDKVHDASRRGHEATGLLEHALLKDALAYLEQSYVLEGRA
jgi:hypothetical protein